MFLLSYHLCYCIKIFTIVCIFVSTVLVRVQGGEGDLFVCIKLAKI